MPIDQAWIDVGGTFTDCYLSPAIGPRRRTKVLSTGLVPISLEPTADHHVVIAPQTHSDVDNFWASALINCYDDSRQLIDRLIVVHFNSRRSELTLNKAVPAAARYFELDAGLEAPVLAVRRLLQCPLGSELPKLQVRMGTTRGTNALLTRRGAKVALAITHSLKDLLLIGDQTRPQLFELSIQRDEALAAVTIPVIERLDAQGAVLEELDEDQTRQALHAARESGCDSLAICLMHSYKQPIHEQRLERLARDVGFVHISRSSALAPLIEIVARARTTVVDAYLGPIVRDYLGKLSQQFGGTHRVQLQVMTSAGGLVDWAQMAGKDSILSGPAGGVVALRALAEATGIPKLIGLDMGGTSTDTCRTAPDQGLDYESTKAGVRILTPTLPIETVASGGGSICWFDGVSLRVGPQSAGAMPGPACYGRNGPLTITDLNVFLGRLPEDQFPFPLDNSAIELRLQQLNEQLVAVNQGFASLELLADGLRAIAANQMAEAVRTVSIAQGADPREHALVGFGGAAGQHICEIADLLGVDRIIHTHDAGLLSALGMGLAAERRDATTPVYQLLDQVDLSLLDAHSQSYLENMTEDWEVAASSDEELHLIEGTTSLQLRYQGTDTSLTIDWAHQSLEQLTSQFHTLHRGRYGYAREQHPLELVAVRRAAERKSLTKLAVHWASELHSRPLTLPSQHKLWSQGEHVLAAYCMPEQLTLGSRLHGPAIVLSPGSTLVIEAGWQADAASDGTLLLTRQSAQAGPTQTGSAQYEADVSAIDPVAEAVFAQRLGAIATQMGLVLQQTAISVNVKQRRDFSCAVFDAQGRMLASAPHVPSISVRWARQCERRLPSILSLGQVMWSLPTTHTRADRTYPM